MKTGKFYAYTPDSGACHGRLEEGDIIELVNTAGGNVIIHEGKHRGRKVHVRESLLRPVNEKAVYKLGGLKYLIIKNRFISMLRHKIYWSWHSNNPLELYRKSRSMLLYYLDRSIKYKFNPWMSEISGFGGFYEIACRTMLDAGIKWWDENPEKSPSFRGLRNVMGICLENNEDAKELSAVMTSTVGDCTGAMHQAVVSSLFWIMRNGWGNYCKEMSRFRNVRMFFRLFPFHDLRFA